MTDPKHPAFLAAERWFDTEQTRSDLVQSARCLVKGWMEDTLRSLARIAFVAGYEAGRKARGATVAAYCMSEGATLDARAGLESCFVKHMALTVQAARVRILAAEIERGDDEHPRD